jgi:hypothetical protein
MITGGCSCGKVRYEMAGEPFLRCCVTAAIANKRPAPVMCQLWVSPRLRSKLRARSRSYGRDQKPRGRWRQRSSCHKKFLHFCGSLIFGAPESA